MRAGSRRDLVHGRTWLSVRNLLIFILSLHRRFLGGIFVMLGGLVTLSLVFRLPMLFSWGVSFTRPIPSAEILHHC